MHNNTPVFVNRLEQVLLEDWQIPIQVSGSEITGTGIGGDIKTNSVGDVFAFLGLIQKQKIMVKSTNGGVNFSSPILISTTFGLRYRNSLIRNTSCSYLYFRWRLSYIFEDISLCGMDGFDRWFWMYFEPSPTSPDLLMYLPHVKLESGSPVEIMRRYNLANCKNDK